MKATYQTQQRRTLLDFFESGEGREFTIEEIIEGLGEDAPGKSTVYRLVKKLEEEGTLRRITREGTSRAVYQLSGADCCAEHLHIKCIDCGLLVHLDSKAQDELARTTGFVIDDSRSMLYGRCVRCARRAR